MQTQPLQPPLSIVSDSRELATAARQQDLALVPAVPVPARGEVVVGSAYEVRRFTSAASPDFLKALGIYSDQIPARLKTSTNEIAYWLENYQARYKDHLAVLGLYFNGNVIGFAQLVYFPEEKLVAVDYLVLDSEHRGLHIYHAFLGAINEYLRALGADYHFIVAEVGEVDATGEPRSLGGGYGKAFMRLLRFSGFRIVKAPYFQPQLGPRNFESLVPATLMLHTLHPLGALRVETYRNIVRTLYYKHYLNWYAMDDQVAYKKMLDALMADIDAHLQGLKQVDLGAGGEILLQGDARSFLGSSASAMLWVLGGATGLSFAGSYLGLSAVEQAMMVFVVLAVFLASAAIVTEKALAPLSKLLDFMASIFRKNK